MRFTITHGGTPACCNWCLIDGILSIFSLSSLSSINIGSLEVMLERKSFLKWRFLLQYRIECYAFFFHSNFEAQKTRYIFFFRPLIQQNTYPTKTDVKSLTHFGDSQACSHASIWYNDVRHVGMVYFISSHGILHLFGRCI